MDQYDRIHIDEKWFQGKKEVQRIYMAHDEIAPLRSTQHKSHIPKVMFLCALGRPHRHVRATNDDEQSYNSWQWDGKVGCYPLIEYRNEQRNSRNRPQGTPEPHAVSMTKDVYESFIIDKLLVHSR